MRNQNRIDLLIWIAAAVIILLALGGLIREALTGDAIEPPPPVETFPELILQRPAPVVTLGPEDGNAPALEPDEACCGLNPETDWEPFVFHEEIPLSESLQCILWDDCQQYGVPYAVALGLIETESNFRPEADNGTCYGLMQLNRNYFPNNLPAGEQIGEGVRFLGELLEKYDGDTAAALTAFNAGHDTGARGYANLVLERAAAWESRLKT